jgi:hypothetical protein
MMFQKHRKSYANIPEFCCPFPQQEKKLCIKYIGKFFLIEKIIFNIVEGNLFPGTY